MSRIAKFKFEAKNAEGDKVKFDIREPIGPNMQRNAWERAELICKNSRLTDLKAKD